MKLDRDQWSRLSALLDTALELAENERERWLQELTGDAAALKEPLRTLLAQRARIETDGFLRAPDFAGALRVETARSQVAPAELRADAEVGGYRLLRELGRGGMGSVWLAERVDGKLKRQVALKFPYAGPQQRQLAERFARERDILASLQHPNIARLYDADVTELGQPFLVLEYVDGIPIQDYCDRQRLSIRQRLVLFLQVLNAVQYAHAHLIIHRDLKPSNILIRDDGVAALLDFGIAKLVAEDETRETALTQMGGRALTPDYASPEQIGGQSMTTASDVYSLGIVLYEILTGNRPYRLKRDSRASLEEAIAEADIIAPSRVTPSPETATARSVSVRQFMRALRGDIDTILCKALQKKSSDRYASVDAFARDIERALDGEVIAAQKPGAWYRTHKFILRNRIIVAATIAVIIALMTGTALAVWQAHTARQQAARADSINRFINSIFLEADPLRGGGRSVSAVDLLLKARQRIDHELAGRPEMQVELLCTVAASLYQLGADAEAANAFDGAFQHAGDDRGFELSPGCRAAYANLLAITGEYARSSRIVQELEVELRNRPASLDLSAVLITHSTLSLNENKTDAAVGQAQEATDIVRSVAGAQSKEYADALFELARAQYHANQTAAALQSVDEALDKFTHLIPLPSTNVTLVRALRARVLSELGRSNEAAQEYAAIIPELRATFGANSHQFSTDLYEFASVQRGRGDLQQAIVLGREALAAVQDGKLSGYNLASLLGGLASSLLNARRIDEGYENLRLAVPALVEAVGADSPLVASNEAAFFWADGLRGHVVPAEAGLLRIIAKFRRDNPERLASPLRYLGEIYVLAGRSGAAVPLLTESVANAQERGNREQIAVSRRVLGLALLETGKTEEAEKELRLALSEFEAMQALFTPVQADVHVGLARICLLRHEWSAALAHTAAADKFWVAFDVNNRWAGDAALWHARALVKIGRMDAAGIVSKRALEQLRKSPFAGDRTQKMD